MMEYNDALEHLEVSMYPDLRKKFLRQSHKNLLCIMKQEQAYFENIQKVNGGEEMSFNCDDTASAENVARYSHELDAEIGGLKSVKEEEIDEL